MGVKNAVDIGRQNFCRCSPGKIGLNFVTENFATFFTARKKFVAWNSLWEKSRQRVWGRSFTGFFFRDENAEIPQK